MKITFSIIFFKYFFKMLYSIHIRDYKMFIYVNLVEKNEFIYQYKPMVD